MTPVDRARACEFVGCGAKARALGLCGGHWYQHSKGRPLAPILRFVTAIDRIMAKVAVNPDSGCWEWRGYRNPKGYGQVGADGRLTLVHRLAAYDAVNTTGTGEG